MDLQPGTVVGSYVVQRRLGRGGMAVVYLVRHQQLRTLHALKVLGMPMAPVQQRLLQEGRVQARLKHANIVTVTDVVDVLGSPGLILEYVYGFTLAELLRDVPLSLEQKDLLARGIVSGVGAAHAAGLVHRDLKPANILLHLTPEGLIPKVTDFGLAKLLHAEDDAENPTLSGHAMGTPAYMAPEQIRDSKHVDQRADIFSLGVVLYEMVTGKRAFDAPDTFETYRRVCDGDFVPIRDVAPDLPPRMALAIDGAMQVDRADRLPDCSALLSAWADEEVSSGGPWDRDTMSRAQEVGSFAGAIPVDLTGSRLADLYATADAETADFVAPISRPGSSPRSGLNAAVAVVVLVATFWGAWVLWPSTPTSTPAPIAVEPQPAPAQEPYVAAEPEPVPIRAPLPIPMPAAPRPEPVPRPKPEPVATSVVQTGRMTIQGDARAVSVLRDGREFDPKSDLDVGIYTVRAVFEEGAPPASLEISVLANHVTTVWCDAAFYRCRLK